MVTFFGLASSEVGRSPVYLFDLFIGFSFPNQAKNELYLVTEYVADGSLDRYLTENMYLPLHDEYYNILFHYLILIHYFVIRKMRSGKIGTETLIQMTRDMAAGCDHLSTHGIVHRVRCPPPPTQNSDGGASPDWPNKRLWVL